MYLDDWPHLGCFSYRMRGFKHQTPTHYFKQYQLSVWKRVSKNYFSRNNRLDDFCIGDTKRHKRVIDLLESFQKTYYNASNTIAIMHYVENSHDTNERLNWVDNDLFEFFSKSNDLNIFENTVIFLYSDHGPRYKTIFINLSFTLHYCEERALYRCVCMFTYGAK
jgi:hypothetical protein